MCHPVHDTRRGGQGLKTLLNMLFLQDFDNVSVEYVTLPGWKASIADCRSFAALPERARAYVEEVERLLGVPGKLRC